MGSYAIVTWPHIHLYFERLLFYFGFDTGIPEQVGLELAYTADMTLNF